MLMMTSFFVGLGPGGLQIFNPQNPLSSRCLFGSTHGGKAPKSESTSTQQKLIFKVGEAYDKENLRTFRGGSGGDFNFSLSVFRLFFLPVFLTGPLRRRSKVDETDQANSLARDAKLALLCKTQTRSKLGPQRCVKITDHFT